MICARTIKAPVFLFAFIISGGTLFAQAGYPVPPKSDNLLFYFQRSHNRNTVVYDLNTLTGGKINLDNPVHAYWIRYEEGGIAKELSFIQRRVFGVQWEITNNNAESLIIHFNAFKKREIRIERCENGKYKAFMTIKNEKAELVSLYIKSENNALGFPLVVNYVELKGISVKNGKMITERITP